MFRKIVRLLARKKITKAKRIFEDNSKDFDNIEKLIIKVLIASQLKDLEVALTSSKELISGIPESYVGYLFHALAQFESNNFEAALKIAKNGLKKTQHYSLHCVRVQALIKKAKTKSALKKLEIALAKDPNNVYLLRTKHIIQLSDDECWYGCAEKPLDVIDSAISLMPNNLSLYMLKAVTLCVMQKYKEVKKLLNKEVNFSLETENPRIYTAAYFLLAYSYIARNKFDKALRIGDKAIFDYENHPLAYYTKALALGYGLIYKMKNKEITEEIFLETIDKALSLDSIKFHKAKYYQLMSDVFIETRGIDDAIDAIDNAISLDPSNILIYQMKMKLLMTDDKSDEALEIVDYLYEENFIDKKDQTKIRSFLIFVEADKTKDPEARKKLIDRSFEEIKPLIDLYPEDASILNNLTVLYGHLGQKEDAIRTAERMIELNPNDGNLFDSYGEMQMLFGDYEEAIVKFKRALKLEPKGWFAFQTYLKMGTCYEKLFKLDEAEENYLKGKELTDKMHLIKRELYFHKASEKLEGLRKLKEELKNQDT